MLERLTNAALYTHPGAFDTNVRYYAQAEAERARFMPAGRRVEVPTAFSGYPSPAFPEPPREWVERAYDVTRWRVLPEGDTSRPSRYPSDSSATSASGPAPSGSSRRAGSARTRTETVGGAAYGPRP